MRVLHVIPSLSLAHGGPTQAMLVMERALSAEGIEVEIATTDDDGPGRRFGVGAERGMPTGPARRHVFAKGSEFYKWSPQFSRWIDQAAGAYDLVHVHALFSHLPVAAARAARHARRPYVVRPLGVLNQWGMTQRRPGLKALSMRWVEGPLLRDAAAVHFTSQAEADEALALGWPLRPRVIGLGVDTPPRGEAGRMDARFAALRGRRCVLYLSRLDPKKNAEALLDAFAVLRPAESGLCLLMVGSGEPAYVERLKQRAQALGLAGSVVWAGHLQGQDKAAALARAALYVLPSHSENFGIAAVEAMAAGLPCILGRGVAVATQAQAAQAACVIEPQAPALADAMQHIIQDDAAARALGEAGAALAQAQFSTQAMGRALVQLYRDIIHP